MDFSLLLKDPDKRARSLVKKLTHSGETDLDKQLLQELKGICKASKDDFMIVVYKECMKCLNKEHSQVRVSTVKLVDYLFQKSHVFRKELLEEFNTFLELTLAVSEKPSLKLTLPPPKKFALLLQELTAKIIHSWHADFGSGYERIKYVYRFLREHQLVDFSRFQVRTHEDLINRDKLLKRQEKILTQSIENRLREFREIKPEIEQLIAQIESLADLLMPPEEGYLQDYECLVIPENAVLDQSQQQRHGIANFSQEIALEFSPYVEIKRNRDNKDMVQNLKELKRQLAEVKLVKLASIEKTISKRSDQFVNTLKELIDLKSKALNVVLKLSELKFISDNNCEEKSKKSVTLDEADSSSESDEDADFEDVEEKEDIETYIPKSMRLEYGLEAIDPKELPGSSKVQLTDESFIQDTMVPGCSGTSSLIMTCNVRLESGRLCPRRDKVKCPFHGKIIPRDHKGIPLDENDRLEEEARISRSKPNVPDWQDPELLREIKQATGVDLTMPKKGKSKQSTNSKLSNTKTCDLTPKQRLQKRLKKLSR